MKRMLLSVVSRKTYDGKGGKMIDIFLGESNAVLTFLVGIDYEEWMYDYNVYDLDSPSEPMPTISDMSEEELFQFTVYSKFGDPDLARSVQRIIENNKGKLLNHLGHHTYTVEY